MTDQEETFEAAVIQMIQDLQREVEVLKEKTNWIQDRIEALEGWPRRVRLTERITALENGSRLDDERLREIPAEQIRRAEHMFSVGKGPDILALTNTGASKVEIAEKGFEEGLAAGRTSALQEAALRVKKYMTWRNLGQGTIQGVVQALLGEVPWDQRPAEDMTVTVPDAQVVGTRPAPPLVHKIKDQPQA